MKNGQTLVVPNVNEKTFRIELFIAQLLRWGVLTSFVIIAVGLVLMLATGQTGYSQMRLDDVNSLVQYHTQPDFPNTVGDVWRGLLALKPYAIITLGLMILIAIPVMRVAVSVLAFAVERDWLYVGITLFVFIVLIVSFALGEAGGG